MAPRKNTAVAPSGDDDCDESAEDAGDPPRPRRRDAGKRRKPAPVTGHQLAAKAAEKAEVERAERFGWARDHEWEDVPLSGGPKVVAAKRDVLAHMEQCGAELVAARLAGVSRVKYEGWIESDPAFREAVQGVIDFCLDQADSAMFVEGMSLWMKTSTTARFGYLNAKSDEYGLMKAQMIQKAVSKQLDEYSRIVAEETTKETSDKIRARFTETHERASSLPLGASVK